MKTVKAELIKVIGDDYVPVIYIGGRWRSFATPYSPKSGGFQPHTKKPTAKRAAEKVAAALGITLKWEVSG